MGAKKKVTQAGAAAYAARNNPYVQRVVDDEELRANLWQAYESARAAAGRLSNGKPTTTQIFDDKKLQKDIREAAENLRTAYDSARKAYARMSNGKGPAHAIMDDKKTQKELREAAHSLREAADTLRGKRKRKHRLRRVLALAIVGTILAMVLSESLRKSVLDALFGAEEEFEYSSSTSPQSTGEPVGTA